MKIGTFFEKTLGANLANSRWSWGAFNPASNQIFLRIWEDGIQFVDGVERVNLVSYDWKGKSAGFPERKRHVELLRNGAQGYGVVCTAVDSNPDGNRAIDHFDDQTLLKFGDLTDQDNRVYAEIIDRIPVTNLSQQQSGFSTLLPDIRSINAKKLELTMKETLANARIGQGIFRSQVLARWTHRCAVTGATTLAAIRASHIKPWRESNDNERLDPNNGIPLVATLDALFDAGLISFQTNGKMLLSSDFTPAERTLLVTDDASLTHAPNSAMKKYPEYHRNTVFRDS